MESELNRLIVHHPRLARAMTAPFVATLGRDPDSVAQRVARWDDVSLAPREVAAIADIAGADAAIVDAGLRLGDHRLLVFDMDSTLITIECIDEIADFAGRKPEVARITEAAMRGEITDYNESLRRRVALLSGLELGALRRVYDERVRLSPGAETLVSAAHRAGLRILLVSGGFTYFTTRIAERLAIEHVRSNELEVADGRLTGALVGEIVNADVKRRVVEETCAAIGCTPGQAIVIGDGANDLKMMAIAGISVAYRAKPVVRAQTTVAINHGGLDAVLNLFSDCAAPGNT